MKVILTYLSVLVIAALLITCGSEQVPPPTIDVECQLGRTVQITCDSTTIVTFNCMLGNEVYCGEILFRVSEYVDVDTIDSPFLTPVGSIDMSTIEAVYLPVP
jgi:hypothetical protein